MLSASTYKQHTNKQKTYTVTERQRERDRERERNRERERHTESQREREKERERERDSLAWFSKDTSVLIYYTICMFFEGYQTHNPYKSQHILLFGY